MVKIAFKSLKFGLNGSNLHLNALNPLRLVRICIQMLRVWFEWFEFEFERAKFLSNGQNLHSNVSILVRVVRICI